MFKRLSFIFALSLTICLFLFSSVQAAPPIKDINYAGKFVSQSVADPIEIEVGKNREVVVKIKILIFLLINCIISLSPVTIIISKFLACMAKVPIKSSASYPDKLNSGILKALIT